MIQKWEYLEIKEKFFGKGITLEKLNELGKEGWELVAPSSYGQLSWYFKRPLP